MQNQPHGQRFSEEGLLFLLGDGYHFFYVTPLVCEVRMGSHPCQDPGLHSRVQVAGAVTGLAGTRSSLQSHERKLETIYVLGGRIELETHYGPGDVMREMVGKGEAYTVPPGTRHRVTVVEDARLIEVSTPELDDVIRHADDYQRA